MRLEQLYRGSAVDQWLVCKGKFRTSIPKDENCLYKTISHQVSLTTVTLTQQLVTYTQTYTYSYSTLTYTYSREYHYQSCDTQLISELLMGHDVNCHESCQIVMRIHYYP